MAEVLVAGEGRIDDPAPAPRDGSGGWGAPPGAAWPPPPPPSPPGRRRRGRLVIGAAALVTATTGFGLGAALQTRRTTARAVSSTTATAGSRGSTNASDIANQVDAGLVDIVTTLGYQNGEAAGTGMVLRSTGEVLTNNHVVNGSTSIRVTDVGNGRTYSATVVGTDAADDIAVLQLQGASGLTTVTLGDSSKVAVGDTVLALGNAGGTGGTPTASGGTITALNQSITASDDSAGSSEPLTGLLQTDATLQPGDSGGPLVNGAGQVIGINTAASTGFQFQAGASEGFAIPINQAVSIAQQIEAGHSSATIHIGPAAFLGVLGIELQTSGTGGGAVVASVETGYPAQPAGLVAGDVITSLNGQTVDSPTTLSTLMQAHHPGDKVTIGWVDQSGQQHRSPLVLATGPAN